MTLMDSVVSDSVIAFSDFGETVSYDPAGAGAAFNVTAILGVTRNDDMGEGFIRDVRTLKLKESDMTAAGVTSITTQFEHRAGDKVTIGSTTWTVSAYPPPVLGHGIWTITLEKDVKVLPSLAMRM